MTCKKWKLTRDIWHTWDVNIVSKFQVPSSNGLTDFFVWRFPLYSYLTTICCIPFHFIFILFDIFNPYPDWVTFEYVFSFGQHLLWWEGLFPFALWKMPSYNPWQNALIQNTLFKKGIINKSILSSGIGGHYERANGKCAFTLSKMPLCIPWETALIQNALLRKIILNEGILSRDIGGHFWKGKWAFPPKRQKPLCFCIEL